MEDVQALLEARSEARTNRNWAEADRLRQLIEAQGFQAIDRKDGTSFLKGGAKPISGKREQQTTPEQEQIHAQCIDADGLLWGYSRHTFSETGGRLIKLCRVNDIESQSAFVQAAIAKHRQRCKSMCLFCGTQPKINTRYG